MVDLTYDYPYKQSGLLSVQSINKIILKGFC